MSRGFVGDIIIDQDPEAALAFAKQEYDEECPINNGSRLVFWTHALSTSKTPGVGVVYKSSKSQWIQRQYHVTFFVKSDAAKIIAIEKALQNARDICADKKDKPSTVVVYSDSKAALIGLREHDLKPYGARTSRCVVSSNGLSHLDVAVELRWLPADSELEGFKLSQGAARLARRKRYPGLGGVVEVEMEKKIKLKIKKRMAYMAGRLSAPETHTPAPEVAPLISGGQSTFPKSSTILSNPDGTFTLPIRSMAK